MLQVRLKAGVLPRFASGAVVILAPGLSASAAAALTWELAAVPTAAAPWRYTLTLRSDGGAGAGGGGTGASAALPDAVAVAASVLRLSPAVAAAGITETAREAAPRPRSFVRTVGVDVGLWLDVPAAEAQLYESSTFVCVVPVKELLNQQSTGPRRLL